MLIKVSSVAKFLVSLIVTNEPMGVSLFLQTMQVASIFFEPTSGSLVSFKLQLNGNQLH